jgi:hypothetical protein
MPIWYMLIGMLALFRPAWNAAAAVLAGIPLLLWLLLGDPMHDQGSWPAGSTAAVLPASALLRWHW